MPIRSLAEANHDFHLNMTDVRSWKATWWRRRQNCCSAFLTRRQRRRQHEPVVLEFDSGQGLSQTLVAIEPASLALSRFLVSWHHRSFPLWWPSGELQTAQATAGLVPPSCVTYGNGTGGAALPRLPCCGRAFPGRRPSALDRSCGVNVWGVFMRSCCRPAERAAGARINAHSSGYGFDLPPGCARSGACSKNTLRYWGETGRPQPLFLVSPMPWSPSAAARARQTGSGRCGSRPIDAAGAGAQEQCLLCDRLAPALRGGACGWSPARLGGGSCSSCAMAPPWCLRSPARLLARRRQRGFGLPPREALACGCVVFQQPQPCPG